MSQHHPGKNETAAEVQFNTSSMYPSPAGYKRWVIRNDYPPPQDEGHHDIRPSGQNPGLPGQLPSVSAPWLEIDFTKEPMKYMNIIKQYIFEGNTEVEFVVQENKNRDWYHSPWMHYSTHGREPLHGLTYEGPMAPNDLALNQKRYVQSWACTYHNSSAASVFGGVWADPNAPQWERDLHFPPGSLIFKNIFSDGTDEELPNMKGSPEWKAIIAERPKSADEKPVAEKRNKDPTPVRVIQIDIAAVDYRRPSHGWVFGSFIYDGRSYKPHAESVTDKWERMIPIGLQWGNDPELTEEAFLRGDKPKESWINPIAEALLRQLKGDRPAYGWNGRMNGPTDTFISACLSCHATAQRKKDPGSKPTEMVPPAPKFNEQTGLWEPVDDKVTMRWFCNLWCGEPFDEDAWSADNSMQVMIGYENYQRWMKEEGHVPHREVPPIRHIPGRSGPVLMIPHPITS